MKRENNHMAIAITGSVSAPCEIKQTVVRVPGRPKRFARLRKDGVNHSSIIIEAQFHNYVQRGLITRMAEEREIGTGTLAFYAHWRFLVAYQTVCDAPFPWQQLKPMELESHPTAKEDMFSALVNQNADREGKNRAVFADLDTLNKLRLRAGSKLLEKARDRACEFLAHESGSENQRQALRRLTDMGWLGTFCVGRTFPDLLVAFHQLLTVSLLLQKKTEVMRSIFDLDVKPNAKIDWETYMSEVQELLGGLKAAHGLSCQCHRLKKAVLETRDQETAPSHKFRQIEKTEDRINYEGNTIKTDQRSTTVMDFTTDRPYSSL